MAGCWESTVLSETPHYQQLQHRCPNYGHSILFGWWTQWEHPVIPCNNKGKVDEKEVVCCIGRSWGWNNVLLLQVFCSHFLDKWEFYYLFFFLSFLCYSSEPGDRQEHVYSKLEVGKLRKCWGQMLTELRSCCPPWSAWKATFGGQTSEDCFEGQRW